MLKDFFNQYKYLIDEECYINTSSNRTLTSLGIIGLLVKLGQTNAKAIETAESMKISGITRAQVKRPKANANIFLAESYERVKAALGLRRESKEGCDKLYAYDERSQVTLCGDLDIDKFRSLVVANPKAYDALKTEFELSAHATFYQTKFSFKTFVDALYQSFLMDPSNLLKEAPALISWSPDIPAYRVLDPASLVPGPTPNWDSFLSRMDFPDVFKAWLWGVFEPKNVGRQSLWVKGPGSDGKSTAINAIAAFLGRDYVHSIVKGAYDSPFFYSGAYGKRFSVYMDCKNPFILGSEKIKSMLGRDSVSIEKKYQHSFTEQLHNKLMILSNRYPSISYSDKSERTRLLMCEVTTYDNDLGDSDFEHGLKSEFPSFLLQCKEVYSKYCPNHANYITPKDMVQKIKTNTGSKVAEVMERFLEEFITFTPDARAPKLETVSLFMEYLYRMRIKDKGTFTEDDFCSLLETKGVKPLVVGSTTYLVNIEFKKTTIDYASNVTQIKVARK